jgi:hypothetical protein
MKKILFSLSLMAITLFIKGQDNKEVSALLNGYKASDTILIDDFIKINELSLSKPGYSITSFVLIFVDNGYQNEVPGKSAEITEEMKKSLLNRISKNDKLIRITFSEIKVKTPSNNEIKIGSLVHKLGFN